jgi:signal transduction histidine kinase
MLSLYRESLAPVGIDLKDMLESILMLMERRFLTLGVTVQPDLPPNLIIHGFPAELRQVFTNLLTNAAEAAGSNSGDSRVIFLTAAPDPAHLSADGLRREAGVIVSVHDHGPGIPEDIRPKLFQPFFSTKGEQGTGLGLWVSRGIVIKHGGEILLESSTAPQDHGTTVSVFLATNPTLNPAGD